MQLIIGQTVGSLVGDIVKGEKAVNECHRTEKIAPKRRPVLSSAVGGNRLMTGTPCWFVTARPLSLQPLDRFGTYLNKQLYM